MKDCLGKGGSQMSIVVILQTTHMGFNGICHDACQWLEMEDQRGARPLYNETCIALGAGNKEYISGQKNQKSEDAKR